MPFFSVSQESDLALCDNSTPERSLLAAILERANRDLNPETTPRHYRRSAITWFSARKIKKKTPFNQGLVSFQNCIDELSLSSLQIKHIERRVKLAEEYDRRKKAGFWPTQEFLSEYQTVFGGRPRRARCVRGAVSNRRSFISS